MANLERLLCCSSALGCADPPHEFVDRWTPTNEICAWSERTDVEIDGFGWYQWYADANEGQGLYPSTDCVDAVLEDFGVDRAAVEAADPSADPYAYLTEIWEPPTVYATVLSGAWPLFNVDFGDLEVTGSDLLSVEFVRTVQEVGDRTSVDSFRASLYNLLTSTILETVPEGSREGEVAHFRGRTLSLDEGCIPSSNPVHGSGLVCTELLVHEAWHAFGPRHIDRCLRDAYQDHCDRNLDGSYGAEVAMWVRALELDPDDIGLYGTEVLKSARRINSLVLDDGDIDPHWIDLYGD